MENKDKIISVLNGLIEICKDGEKGYQEAADTVRNAFYRVLFSDYARLRSAFASQLQAVVRTLGGAPGKRGTIAGSLHRGWISLRLGLDSNNDEAIIKECKRGESTALESYRAAIKTDLPSNIKIILEKQFAVIHANLQRVHVMIHDARPTRK